MHGESVYAGEDEMKEAYAHRAKDLPKVILFVSIILGLERVSKCINPYSKSGHGLSCIRDGSSFKHMAHCNVRW